MPRLPIRLFCHLHRPAGMQVRLTRRELGDKDAPAHLPERGNLDQEAHEKEAT